MSVAAFTYSSSASSTPVDLSGTLIEIIFNAGKCGLCVYVLSDPQDTVMVPWPHYERGIPQDDYAAGPS